MKAETTTQGASINIISDFFKLIWYISI